MRYMMVFVREDQVQLLPMVTSACRSVRVWENWQYTLRITVCPVTRICHLGKSSMLFSTVWWTALLLVLVWAFCLECCSIYADHSCFKYICKITFCNQELLGAFGSIWKLLDENPRVVQSWSSLDRCSGLEVHHGALVKILCWYRRSGDNHGSTWECQ